MRDLERTRALIEEAVRLTSPHGLPSHMEGVVRTFKCAAGYILAERRNGRRLTVREMSALDERLRVSLYKMEWGKSRVSLQVKDVRATYRFFDQVSRVHFNGALEWPAKDFARVMLALGIKNMTDLRSFLRNQT